MRSLFSDFAKIEDEFNTLTDYIEKCLSNSFETLNLYLEEGETEAVTALSNKVHSYESKADDVRRRIIGAILKGSLMPHTRSDILRLVEALDEIADQAEDILDDIIFLQLKFQYLNHDKLYKMEDLINKQFQQLKQAVNFLFDDMNKALDYANELEKIESEVDDIEEDMIRETAKLAGNDNCSKLTHRSLIVNISDLSDIIENVGDIVEAIISIRKG
ncbi:MAG: DUF47 domain-containing protein [Bacillota bacterium]